MKPMPALVSLLLLCAACTGMAGPTASATDATAASEETTAARARTIALRAAQLLRDRYLDPDQGARYAQHLDAQAARGAYDALEGRALADRITRDLNALHADGHLRLRFGTSSLRGPAGPVARSPRPPRAPAGPIDRGIRPIPGGPDPVDRVPPADMEQAGWIAPGIAFVRFNAFPDNADLTAAANAFMRDHAQAKTVIFDLRTHRGGGMQQMDAILPWLYAKPTHLVTMDNRDGTGPAQSPSSNLRPAAADPDIRRFEHWVTPGQDTPLRKATIWVLVSPATGSAAEHLAAALQWSGRARLVGAGTAGANHFGAPVPLGGGFDLFVPEGRTYNPANGQDWEGSGLTPDVVVAPEQALTEGLRRSGVENAQAQALSASHAPQLPMQRPPLLH